MCNIIMDPVSRSLASNEQRMTMGKIIAFVNCVVTIASETLLFLRISLSSHLNWRMFTKCNDCCDFFYEYIAIVCFPTFNTQLRKKLEIVYLIRNEIGGKWMINIL